MHTRELPPQLTEMISKWTIDGHLGQCEEAHWVQHERIGKFLFDTAEEVSRALGRRAPMHKALQIKRGGDGYDILWYTPSPPKRAAYHGR